MRGGSKGRRTDRNTDSGSNKLKSSLLLRRSSNLQSRKVSYGKWLEVMSAYMPEFEGLWSEYGARLLGGHAFPPIPPGVPQVLVGPRSHTWRGLGASRSAAASTHHSPHLTITTHHLTTHHSHTSPHTHSPLSPLTTLTTHTLTHTPTHTRIILHNGQYLQHSVLERLYYRLLKRTKQVHTRSQTSKQH